MSSSFVPYKDNVAPIGHVELLAGSEGGSLEPPAVQTLVWVLPSVEEVDEGRRLRGLSFEENVKAGSALRRQIHTFDYQRRKWVAERWKPNGAVEKTVQEIPEGTVYDDFITAAYNFRFGVYGPIERGKKIRYRFKSP
jgi:hypothetical protein